MNERKRKTCLFFLLLITSLAVNAQQMLVGSYNIRYKNSDDSINGNGWTKRCQVLCDQVNFMSPDIWGAQEVLHTQLVDLLNRLDGYSYIGVGRDDGKTEGEYAAIFYKKDKLHLLDKGHFWLNETPDKPVTGWDAACVRICTWGKFQAKKQQPFYFFNLHMDHVGTIARREAAKLVVAKIKSIISADKNMRHKQDPIVILTGDFNVDQENEIYKIFTESGILKDSYHAARIRFAENGTCHGFNSDSFTTSRIDHVFVSPNTQVDAYGVLTDSYWTPDSTSVETQNGNDMPKEVAFKRYIRRQPSDHYPVLVRLKY
jgi:endonuclease/exonuclease/phosphatase family metal-dependent hydrolase